MNCVQFTARFLGGGIAPYSSRDSLPQKTTQTKNAKRRNSASRFLSLYEKDSLRNQSHALSRRFPFDSLISLTILFPTE
ncbi:hypothetical protein A3A38_01425 [Candidatus Kaiserbacteria bacterium RIFCSPLOWO2_01_FULL_53_17]|uniref:Uncharacterized protein n=1 Tax=Candidatus Kaiserbacteria bacterium RIFCSPLOWO2_01_FULL_53_17 TaxID=1798511 RepID=A0A1F6EI75_9BACT|nr:MAG: hypothetical protein A3A38_01425 [Candidatus Kaiserbacteria bacterium RIFCSPLOWO2_01_FULL_53_17]